MLVKYVQEGSPRIELAHMKLYVERDFKMVIFKFKKSKVFFNQNRKVK